MGNGNNNKNTDVNLFQEVSPVLDFFYEIFSSRSELIAQAFAAEMLSLIKAQIAYDELTADSGNDEQDWINSVDKIFDFVTFVITCESHCFLRRVCFAANAQPNFVAFLAETLKVKKPTFEKFRAWLVGIEGLTKGKDKKQLAGLDQDHRFKKGFLRHVSTIVGPLLQHFAACSQPSNPAASAEVKDAGEEQAEE